MTGPSPGPRARLLGLAAVVVILAASCSLPELDEESRRPSPLAQTSKIFDARGRLITALHAEQDRVVIPFERIPEHVKDAVVAIEDQRFWYHRGIDLKALARAAYANLTAGAVVEGGSTITEQFVKNRIVGAERTLGRKIEEAALAWQLEDELTKEEILGRYLNTVYFGRGAYGIQRAALTYFSVPASDLNLVQGATLAGLIAAPEVWDPVDNPEGALQRRNVVLARMRELGMIPPQVADAASAKPLGLDPREEQRRYPAAHFVDHVKREFLADPQFGETYEERYRLLFEGGIRIYTTIDLRLQRAAERAVREILFEEADPYAALTAVDPRTGYIRAMVGGRDYFASAREDPYSKVNLATGRGGSGRQAGSAFKPFALVAALEAGIAPTATYPAPASVSIEDPECLDDGEPWAVSNYSDASFGGSMTLEEATIGSVNVVYAQVVEDIGAANVAEVAHRMGIRSRLQAVCSLALGSGEVNTLEMASAYGTLATNGRHTPPIAIERVEDPRGNVIFQAHPRLRQVVNPAVAWVATQILRKVVLEGTGAAANIGRPQAGKTGTAQLYRDAWYAGYIPQLSTAVWVGHPRGQVSMSGTRIGQVTGGSWPAQIWHAFMSAVSRHIPVREFEPPEDAEFVTVPIDVTRGCLATETTPDDRVRYVQYVPGTEPQARCDAGGVATGAVVPSVVGTAASEAYSTLQGAGFSVTQTTKPAPSYPSGTVVRQTPPGGSGAPEGSTVTLVVASR